MEQEQKNERVQDAYVDYHDYEIHRAAEAARPQPQNAPSTLHPSRIETLIDRLGADDPMRHLFDDL